MSTEDHFAAQLGVSRSGRLRFMNGAHRVAIRADLRVRCLYRARFGDRMPMVGVQGGVVTIRYPRVPACDWLNCLSERPAEVELNARMPWEIEVRGGASRLVADLRELRIGSLSMNGGASRLEMVLPTPAGTVLVVILGGASNVAICRPEGVAARLRVGGGATHLRFDDRRIGAAGGELDLLRRRRQPLPALDRGLGKLGLLRRGHRNLPGYARLPGWPDRTAPDLLLWTRERHGRRSDGNDAGEGLRPERPPDPGYGTDDPGQRRGGSSSSCCEGL
jgi:hypothetical protein